MYKKLAIGIILCLLVSMMSFAFAEDEYYIQAGAFKYYSNAEKYADYVQTIGFKCVIKEVHGWYKVFIGPYESEAEARQVQEAFEKNGESGFLIQGSKIYDVTLPPPSNPLENTTSTEKDPGDVDEDQMDENNDLDEEDSSDPETQTDQGSSSDTETQTNPEDEEDDMSADTESAGQTDTESATENENSEVASDQEDENGIVTETDDLKDEMDRFGEETEEKSDRDRYKVFTIILITVLWLTFILSVIAFRLNQNRKMK